MWFDKLTTNGLGVFRSFPSLLLPSEIAQSHLCHFFQHVGRLAVGFPLMSISTSRQATSLTDIVERNDMFSPSINFKLCIKPHASVVSQIILQARQIFKSDKRWLVSTFVILCLQLSLIFNLPLANAQSVMATIGVGNGPRAPAINPVTNKIYVANASSNNVTIIDGTTNATAIVAAGTSPRAIAINAVTNQIYVANFDSNNVTVIDGATNTTTNVTAGNAPCAIAINPITNKIYVSNQNSNNVTVIDGATNVATTLAVGSSPRGLAVNPITNKIYVTNFFGNSVTVIDGVTNAATTLAVGTGPSAVAINPLTNKIYVGNFNGVSVTVIDGATNATATVAAGASPVAIAVNVVSNKIYVANGNGTTVTVINGATNATTTVVTGTLTGNGAIAVNPITNKIYTTVYNGNNVTIIDGATNTTTTLAVGSFPFGVAVNTLSNKIYVTNQNSANVTIIDGSTNTTATVAAGTTPLAIAINPISNKIYVINPSSNSVIVIDGATNTPTAIVTAGNTPVAIALNPVTNKVYVTNQNSANVTVIDGVTNTTITVAVGVIPTAVAVNPVSNKIYVANAGSNNITVINGATNGTATVAAGTSPFAIAVNLVTNKIYVANYNSANVTVIDGTTNTTSTVTAGTSPRAIAVNAVSNKIYVANVNSNNVTVIDGLTNTTATVTVGTNPFAIAVNPVSNKIYTANFNSANVTVIDGTTNTTATVTAGTSPRAIAINPVSNKIYAANYNSANVTVIDGTTNTTATVTAGASPVAITVNPVSNQIYAANESSANLTVITPAIENILPLTTAISMSGIMAGLNNATANTTPSFTFVPSSTYAPATLAIRSVYYRLNNSNGAWSQATGAGPTFNATLPALPSGEHVLYAYAVDSLEGGVTVGSNNFGTGNSPLVGSIAAFQFAIINPFTQIITGFTPASPVVVGAASASLSATGGASGNALTFATTSLASICTVTGANQVNFIGAGTCQLTANQAGGGNFSAAPQVSASIVINQTTQTITGFAPVTPVVFGAPSVTLSATASSGLAVVFATTSAASVCTVAGNQVSLNGAGTCNLTANQTGDANYSAAPQASASIVINQATQTITGFAPVTPVLFGATAVTLNATGGASGNAVIFATTSAASICTVAGNQVSFTGAGTCNLTANQAGNTNYTATLEVTASIVINQAAQTITGFAPASPVVFGAAAATLSATGGATGNMIVFATTSLTSVCTVTGNQVTFVGGGICNLTANQLGNANYLAAPQVAASIVINQAAQTISGFAPATPVVFGAVAATLTATGGASGNAIVFGTSSAATICTVTGNQVSFVGTGTCNLTANQAGNTNYAAATQVTASIVINQASQTITGFTPASPVIFGAAAVTLTATGGASGNTLTFATISVATICTVTGNQVNFIGAGTCTLTANQAGNANYLAAPQVTASIVINQATQLITISATPTSLFTNAAPFTVIAAGGASGNVVIFTITTPLICTSSGVNGSLITLTQQSGTCTIRANQAGNGNYLAATSVERSIAIGFEPPPPPPTVPTNLTCTASVVVEGKGVIDCTFSASTSESSRNPIQSYRLYCTNNIAKIAVQVSVASTETRAAITNAPVGRYHCNVTAEGEMSASEQSDLARLVLSATPLSLSGQFDPDSKGFATILVRGSAPPITDAPLTTKATTITTQIGRFDGTKFNFTATTDIGEGWNVLGLGDLTGSNRSSVIGRNVIDEVRVDTGLLSTTLRKAKSDWSLEAVTDLDGDGKADMVWRYMKPGTNDSGVIFAWYMNSEPLLNVNEVRHRGGAPLNWSLIGATDIDGDGKADLIWLSPTNEIRSLTSKANRTWVNERIGQLPTGFNIIKLGDVNGDGKGDIVFKDAQGNVKVWLMDGTKILLDSAVGNVAVTTTFYAAGDFDGDGTIDIVWKKADGTLTLWLMNKAIINQPTVMDNVGQAPVGSVVVE
jgi:YVTN family beta-propeller protein